MAFDKNKVTSVNQIHGGITDASGILSIYYDSEYTNISDFTTASTELKEFLASLNILMSDWVMVKFKDITGKSCFGHVVYSGEDNSKAALNIVTLATP